MLQITKWSQSLCYEKQWGVNLRVISNIVESIFMLQITQWSQSLCYEKQCGVKLRVISNIV